VDEHALRENVVDLLTKAQAHAGARKAFAGLRPENRHSRPRPDGHTVWEQLEHLRIAQEDIVRYALDPSWRSPEWPAGYWPPPTERLSEEAWSASLASFFSGLDEAVALARNPQVDLTSRIPHGEGRTYLRQLLLIADHNAYHLGQVVEARKALGDWGAK
jgi:uncharacterized damage-inducible protein DinB